MSVHYWCMRSNHQDAAQAAHLIDDLLTATGATQEDRQVVADHLTGRRRTEVRGIGHDSWRLVMALARAWHAYTQRAGVPARVLPRVLDGECSTVTACYDDELVGEVLEGVEDTPDDLAQVRAFTAWLEPEDVWDDEAATQRLRQAWARFRTQAWRPTDLEAGEGPEGDPAPSRTGRVPHLRRLAEETRYLMLATVTARDVRDDHPDIATDDAEQVAALVRESAGSRPDDTRLGAAWEALNEETGL